MRTEMYNARPLSINVVSARRVTFTFDLREPENSNMRDPDVVRRSMAMYLLEYSRMDTYSVEYVGDWLILTVTGNIHGDITSEMMG